MNSKSYMVVLFAAIILTVAIAGCTSTGNSTQTPAVNSTSTGPTATVTATPMPKAGDQIVIDVMPKLSQVRWYEYHVMPSGTPVAILDKYTTEGADIIESWNFSEGYQGQPADKAVGSVAYPSMGASGTTIAYVSPANHSQILGGTITIYYNGKEMGTTSLVEHPEVLSMVKLLDLTNSSYTGKRNVTYGGVEQVTVPAGSYSATKYQYNDTMQLTVYMADTVPVPVKMHAVTDVGTIYDVELKAWG